MIDRTTALDYLIFDKADTEKNTYTLNDFTREEITQHMKNRLQLDFYTSKNISINDLDECLVLNSSHWRDADFVQHMPRSNDTVVAHLIVNPVMLVLPILHDGHEHQVTDITISVTAAQHNFTPFDSVTRLARMPEPIAELTELPALINHINAMYSKSVFRLNLLLDAGMLIGKLNPKQLSYLKTSFRQNFGTEYCRLFVTNSRSDLGAKGKAITPFAMNHHEISASKFISYLYADDINFAASDYLHVLNLKSLIHYQALPKLKDKTVTFLDSFSSDKTEQVTKKFSGTLDKIQKAQKTEKLVKPTQHKEYVKIGKSESAILAKNTDAKKKTKDSKTKRQLESRLLAENKIKKSDGPVKASNKSQASSVKIHQSSVSKSITEDDLKDYANNMSPSDIIRRHTRKTNRFDPRVEVIKPGKKTDANKDETK